ncbi:protease inhibitor I42 family protein [Dermatobacter hominis]|uniref:protease inhibitor I42 family protein n=1 Tax=Dermatobacter hominis TaxID=2884263 RepID=UPI001D123CA2|nr:protease inhibitor I42 family protein [Dermatobacter hominis]UDY36520.1 protease inhibitor I42 family protein [Dermatobacter hominis]
MRTIRRILIGASVLLLAAVPLAACSDDDDSATTTTAAERSTTTATAGGGSGQDGEVITASGPVELGVGERVTIELEGNVTTGYSWTIDQQPDAAVVEVVSDRYVGPGDGAAAGQGGHQEVVLEGVAAGTTTLGMGYARPWEEGTPPVQTATFAITVR